MTFIYWCIDDMGTKTSFESLAILDIGMRIPSDNGGSTTIVDMGLIQDFVNAGDLHTDYEVHRMMSI